MRKKIWDYLFVMGDEERPRYVNGQEIPNWKEGPTLSDAMHYLIRKGWKLVSHSSAVRLGYPLIFRRRKK